MNYGFKVEMFNIRDLEFQEIRASESLSRVLKSEGRNARASTLPVVGPGAPEPLNRGSQDR